jgi:hypothetical protein
MSTHTRQATFAAHAMSALLAATLAVSAQTGRAAEGVRPEVGKPLQAARDLIKAQKFKDALSKVKEADAAGGKSAGESQLIERMRLAAATGAGDLSTATAAFESLDGGGRLAAAEKLQYIESLAGSAYRAKDYARTAQWGQRYASEGGNSASMRNLVAQAQYLSGDHAGAAKAIAAGVQSTEKAGGRPTEDQLKLLLNAAARINDTDRYVYAVEKLLTYYPKKEYWGDVLSRLQTKPNFSERFALDTYRLALATGSLRGPNDYIEMAQLAAQAGFPAEGKQVLDKGYATGVLGTGAGAERHKRLLDLLAKRSDDDKSTRAHAEAQALASPDGNALIKLGFNLALSGDTRKGLSLMQQGIDKGGLVAAEASKLRYGIAQVLDGQANKAGVTFRSVGGKDGAADLARLWAVYARSKSGGAA